MLASLLLPFAAAAPLIVPLGEQASLSASLLAQAHADLAVSPGSDPAGLVRFRRLQPKLGLQAADGRIGAMAHLNVAPGMGDLLDLWVDGQVGEGVRLRAGQFKVPFTAYRLRPFTTIVTTDWPVTSRAIGGERQIGVDLRSTGEAGPAWAVALFTGQNVRTAHLTRMPELYGVPLQNRSSLAAPAPYIDRLHPELVGHLASYTPGFVRNSGRASDGPWERGGALSLALDARPVRAEDLGARAAVEGMLQGRGLGLTGLAFTSVAPTDEGWQPALHGGLTELSIGLGAQLELGVRVAGTYASDPLRRDVAAYRAEHTLDGPEPWRFEGEAAVALSRALPAGTQVMIEVADRHRAYRGRSEDQLLTRAQVQFGF